MIDPDHPELPTVRDRIAHEEVVWLVTVRHDGQPQASPVWAIWDEAGLLIYSQPDTPKLRNIEANPRVVLHLDGGADDHTTAIIEGDATLSNDPPAHLIPAYVAKYGDMIARNGWTPEGFAADYSVPIRVAPKRLRAW
jgi:PPOX class probable F420-dependent enzyme